MRPSFPDAQIVEFLRRSYFVVDGLWFVKAEERNGFDDAMALDEAVWDVMSKIQARKARALLGIEGSSVEDLARAFSLKLASEGYDFELNTSGDEATVTVKVCPWFELLRSSGRTAIAETIADRICAREYAGWTREFGGRIKVSFQERLCIERDDCDTCRIIFRETSQE